MKKNIFGRKLKRDKNERKALFKSLMSSLILHERIQTTEEKAKAIKPEIEKMVTKAKKAGSSSINAIRGSIAPGAFDKFIKNVVPRFSQRNGGYTRIIRLNQRLGDKAQMVLIEWVEAPLQNLELNSQKTGAKNIDISKKQNLKKVKTTKKKLTKISPKKLAKVAKATKKPKNKI